MRYPRASWYILPMLAALAACSSAPPTPVPAPAPKKPITSKPSSPPPFRLENQDTANEIVLYALSLLNTGYKFGGSNPEAGLDCSGMVSYIVAQVTGKKLPHNAAQIASITQEIERNQLQSGDLVFFNTTGQTYSHMGIYIGDGRFVHAPSTRGSVRIESMETAYFAKRFTGARSLF